MRANASVINGISLMVIQGANALFPLFAFPFLLDTLGTNAFAKLVVAEALAFYVLTICLYSFDTSGVLAVIGARAKGSRLEESEYFFNIVGSRIILFFISLPLFLIVYCLISDGSTLIFLAWLAFVLGTILQNNYYFQAIENNWVLAVTVLFSRISALIILYLLVTNEKDVVLASIILGGSYLFSGVAAFVVLLSRLGMESVKLVSVRCIAALLYDGRHLFFGNVSVTLFRNANILILAWVSSSSAVAAYALSEKIIKSIQALARPLNQLFVPKAVNAWSLLSVEQKTNRRALAIIWNNTRIQLFLMLFFLPLAIASIWLINDTWRISGFSEDVMLVIALMAPSVIFGVANAMFGVVGLSLLGAQNYFASSVFFVGAFIFLFSLLMSYYYQAFGAASAFLLAEILLLTIFLSKYVRESSRG